MKGLSTFITFQALLSTISGIMMANMSWIGKVSIFLLYRDYGILKSWWKTALLLFGIQLLIIFILWLSKRLLPNFVSVIIAILLLICVGIGAYYTYLDFTTTSHRLLKSSFHFGGYLFWVACAMTCLYFIFGKIKRNFPANSLSDPIQNTAE